LGVTLESPFSQCLVGMSPKSGPLDIALGMTFDRLEPSSGFAPGRKAFDTAVRHVAEGTIVGRDTSSRGSSATVFPRLDVH